MRAVLIILIAATAFANLGCDAIFDKGCPEDTERWIEYQLFMGLSAPDSDVVDATNEVVSSMAIAAPKAKTSSHQSGLGVG